MPDLHPTELLLVSPAGQMVKRFAAVTTNGTSAQALTEAAERVSGRALWLLHDGGLGWNQSGAPARFEVLDGTQVLHGIGPAGGQAPPLPNARPWQQPGWRGEVLAWTQRQLGEPVRRPDWVHTSDVGAVLTTGTNAELLYFKADEDGREVRAATQIAAQLPTLIPAVVAAEPVRGWLLTPASGDRLLEAAELPLWLNAVQKLAEVHRKGKLEKVPVYRMADLPGELDALMAPAVLTHWGLDETTQAQIRALLPAVLTVHRTVMGLKLPECACHGDFHANNVLVQVGPKEHSHVRLFDWSEACKAHPLTDIGWFLAFAQLPAREVALRQTYPKLGETLWAAYQQASGLQTGLRWQDVALLALFHRAVVYDRRYRHWRGTLAGFQPQYVPYYLRIAREFCPAWLQNRALS